MDERKSSLNYRKNTLKRKYKYRIRKVPQNQTPLNQA